MFTFCGDSRGKYANILGIISGIARGSNQTALGHKFYEATRFLFPKSSRPYLHGEIVGGGLLLQNYFNGEEGNNEYLVSLMKKYGMPHTVSGVGASLSGEFFGKYYDYLKNSSAIDERCPEECEKLRLGLEYLKKIDKGDL